MAAEQTQVISGSPGKVPDIVLPASSQSPVVIETEFLPALTVESDAKKRLRNILDCSGKAVENVIAVRIPEFLRSVSQRQLETELLRAQYSFCVFYANVDSSDSRWPETGWVEGGVNDVADCLESVALTESLLSKSTDILQLGVRRSAAILSEASPYTHEKIAALLKQSEGEQTNRMAAAIIANALIYHRQIEAQGNIPPLNSLKGSVTNSLIDTKVIDCWAMIISTINYVPIFEIAGALLTWIPSTYSRQILNILHATTNQLADLGATELNDLSGRMFQKLIADRKFLATFYTLPVSATFLAELVVCRLPTDWSDKDSVTSLRVGDLACGTGTLIGALYRALISRYRRAGNDSREIHSSMIEKSLYALDIMPAATHLTASTLSSVQPEVPFAETQIATMPYGKIEGSKPMIGALELIEDENVRSLLSLGRKRLFGRNREGSNDRSDELELKMSIEPSYDIEVPHESLDVVIMNPPFTRPTNHEITDVPVPSFAGFGTSSKEQRMMSSRLANLRKTLSEPAGHGNAGLASNFMDLGHVKLKPGGILGLVLPATFAQGDSWSMARKLIEQHYEEVTVISISGAGSVARAFSADTGMAEVLVVAKRKLSNQSQSAAPESESGEQNYQFVNLMHRPAHHMEAIWQARIISQSDRSIRAGHFQTGDDSPAGHVIHAPNFVSGCVGLRESGLGEFMLALNEGHFLATRLQKLASIPIVNMECLGTRGRLSRDLTGPAPRGPFDKRKISPGQIPAYPCLWAHSASAERQLIVEPDCEMTIRPGQRDKALDIWGRTASKLHLTIDFQLNSQSLAACMTREATLGGRAWPNFILNDTRFEKLITLWFNSTIGAMCYWWLGTRQQSGRVSVSISRLPSLVVIDPRELDNSNVERADGIFQHFKKVTFLPANESYRDKNRMALDHAIIVEVLGLAEQFADEFDLIRRQWCAEPRVHGGKSTQIQRTIDG